MALVNPQRAQPQQAASQYDPDPNMDLSGYGAGLPQPSSLSVGKGSTEASIDTVNQWMRSTPWYQGLMKQWGFGDGRPVHLNDAQKTVIMQQAQKNGVQIDMGQEEIDPSGNINPKGHKLRNTLIVAGIAAATIATMGAAGVFAGGAGAAGGAAGAGAEGAALAGGAGAGAAGAGAGAAGAGIAGGILPSTAIGTGLAGTVAGGTGLGAGAYGAGAAGASILGGTAAGSGGGGAAGAGGASTLGTLGKIGSTVAPILGNAAHGQQQSEQQGYQNQVTAEQLRLQEPAAHLSNLLRTQAAANGPVTAHWGGPGSGLRGETLHYSGGFNDPLPDNVKSQMPTLVDQRLQEALAPSGSNPALNPPTGNSAWDKILGGAAIGTSILGGFSPRYGGGGR